MGETRIIETEKLADARGLLQDIRCLPADAGVETAQVWAKQAGELLATALPAALTPQPAPTLGDALGLDTPPSESDHIATMISDLSHTGDLSMLYRMEIADAITSLSAALGSIARNTCCDGCQEAALVARAALKGGAE